MATGAVDPGLDLRLTSPNLGRTKVEDLAVSPDGTRLVAIGALEYAQGVRRDQLVVADTAANPVRPADRYTTAYAADCRDNFDTYLPRGEGVRALVACPIGLLVGSDTDQLGHEYHGRIGMFPWHETGAGTPAPVLG